jgi:type II secretory pathway predicted ATPase ExeA
VQRQPAALLFDDADAASTEVTQQITRLVQHDQRPDSGLTIVIAGLPERTDRLGRRLLELAELRVDLEPWSAEDTANYLHEALHRAGREAPIFETTGAERIHDLAEGTPRRVNQLADLALLAAAGQGLEQIDGRTVDEVFQELAVVES